MIARLLARLRAWWNRPERLADLSRPLPHERTRPPEGDL